MRDETTPNFCSHCGKLIKINKINFVLIVDMN